MTKPAKPTPKGYYKKSLHQMKCLDVYLAVLSHEDLQLIKSKISEPERIKYPLLCWDIFSMYLHQLQIKPYDKRRTHQER